MDTSSSDKSKEWRLYALLLRRDEAAIRAIYQDYGPALFHVILRIVRSRELAEEVLQDVFVKIWDRAAQFDPERGRLFTWMAQTARNQAIDTVRSKTFRQGEKTDDLENSVTTKGSDPGQEMEVGDVGLRKVAGQLEEKHRILIDYLYFRDYTQTEVEKELNIPFGTINSRVRVAFRELRRLLSDE